MFFNFTCDWRKSISVQGHWKVGPGLGWHVEVDQHHILSRILNGSTQLHPALTKPNQNSKVPVITKSLIKLLFYVYMRLSILYLS